MKRFAILFLVLAFAGCDTDELFTDAQRFPGEWRLTQIRDAQGDRTQQFATLGTLDVSFTAGSQYTLLFDAAEGGQDVQLAGNYEVLQPARLIRLNVPTGQFNVPVDFQYNFVNDNTVELVIDATLLGMIIEIADYTGQVRMTLTRG